jgi:hypothetical protein
MEWCLRGGHFISTVVSLYNILSSCARSLLYGSHLVASWNGLFIGSLGFAVASSRLMFMMMMTLVVCFQARLDVVCMTLAGAGRRLQTCGGLAAQLFDSTLRTFFFFLDSLRLLFGVLWFEVVIGHVGWDVVGSETDPW